VFSSVQQGPHVLWHVGFATPGGDGHVHRNVIPAGAPVHLRSLRVLFEFRGTTEPDLRIDDEAAAVGSRFALQQHLTISEAGSTVLIIPADGALNGTPPTGRITTGPDGSPTVELELFAAPEPTPLNLAALDSAFVGGGLSLLPDDEVDQALEAAVTSARADQHIHWRWTPDAQLDLTGRTAPGAVEQHADAHASGIDRTGGVRLWVG
jgi:hypothetical protein